MIGRLALPLARRASYAAVTLDDLAPPRRRPRVPLPIVGCFVVLVIFALGGALADWIAPADPVAQRLTARLRPPAFAGGMPEHLLGTDPLGRDLLSRLIHGARTSLAVGFAGMAIGFAIGTVSGIVAGYARGPLDDGLMFLVDAYIALPFLVIALTMVALLGNSWPVLILIAGMSGWGTYTRVARGQVLAIRELPYVAAARAIGASPAWILARHVLPNVAGPMIVVATFELTSVILLEASLSFLGLGVKPPTPSWGSMLGEGRTYLNTAWWIGVFPGVALVLVTSSISLAGDWLRDVLDPTT
jgi:peptide/nickel transport system permease protein